MIRLAKWVLAISLWMHCLLRAGAAAVDEPKLAIYSVDSDGDALCDLLTTEISALNGVRVVERQQLSRLVGEKSLTGLSSRTFASAGAILQANGIVIVEARRVKSGYAINMRLISIHSGAVIAWWNQTIKEADVSGWSKDSALHVQDFIPKLQRKSLLTISFVGFNSPTSTRESVSLQHQLNILLSARVSAEPDLLLLERQKLLDAAFEKFLGQDDQKFWNGAYLLDGTINPNAIEPDLITIKARVGSEGRSSEFSVRGNRNDLAGFSEQFVRELRATIQPGTAPERRPYDAGSEAQRFQRQAENEVRWGLFHEARAAADTAFALGSADFLTRKIRLAAYTGLCEPDLFDVRQPYKAGFGVAMGFPAPPTDEALESAVEVSYQLREAMSAGMNLFEVTNQSPVNCAIVGVGAVTLKYYLGAELRRQKEDQLAELRSSMRQWMEMALATGSTNKSPGETFDLLERYGPLWFETPESGIRFLRKVKAAPNRNTYFASEKKYSLPDWLPPLAGWKWAERRKADALWESFTAEEEILRTMAGRLNAVAQSAQDSAVKAALQSALEYADQNQAKLMGLGYKTRFEAALGNGWNYQLELMAPAEARALEMRFVQPLKRILADIDQTTASYPALPEYFPERPFGRMAEKVLRLVQNGKAPPIELVRAFQWISRNEVPKAIEALSQVSALPASPAKEAVLTETEDRLRSLRQAQTGLGATRANAQMGELVRARNEALAKLKTAQGRPIVALTNVLALRTSIHLQPASPIEKFPAKLIEFSKGFEPVLGMDWLDGQVWALYQADKIHQWSTGVEGFPEFFLTTVSNFGASTISYQIPANYFQKYDFNGAANVAAFPDAIVILWRDSFFVFNRNSKSFRLIPAPVTSGHLFREGNRLFLMNAESILETTSVLSNFKVIASVRRSPPENSLDKLLSFAPGRLLSDANSSIFFSIDDSFYELKDGKWRSAGNAVPTPKPLSFQTFTCAPTESFRGVIGPQNQAFTATWPEFRRSDFRFDFVHPDHWLINSVNVKLPPAVLKNNGPPPAMSSGGGDLFLWGAGIEGICFIDGAELNRHRQTVESRQERVIQMEEATVRAVFEKLDNNKNGRLDPDERMALVAEPILFNLVWSSIDSNRNDQLDWDELKFFDFDGNGRFGPNEQRAILTAVAYAASVSFRVFDEDKDGFVSAKEKEKLSVPPAFVWLKYADPEKRCNLAQWTDLIIEQTHRDWQNALPISDPPAVPDETFLGSNFLNVLLSKANAKAK